MHSFYAAESSGRCAPSSRGWRRRCSPTAAASSTGSDFFGFALSLNAQGVSVYYSFATPEMRPRRGSSAALTFMAWTVDDEADIEPMVDAGVDSICSNFPDVVRRSSTRGDAALAACSGLDRGTRVTTSSFAAPQLSYTARAHGCSSAGRAAVSKTAGRGFESLHPCQ